MKMIVGVMVFLLMFSGVVSAQLPTELNLDKTWYIEEALLDDTRVSYGYQSNADHCACRIDYLYEGRIRLLATESYYHIPSSPLSSVSTFYFLRPTTGHQPPGNELVRISYGFAGGSSFGTRPVMPMKDLFIKHCLSRLDELFGKIPKPEVKMWKDQFGSVFSVK